MEVAVAPNAPSPEWELKLLPFDEIQGRCAGARAEGGSAGGNHASSHSAGGRRPGCRPHAEPGGRTGGAEKGLQGRQGGRRWRRNGYGQRAAWFSARRFERFRSAAGSAGDPPAAGGVDEATPATNGDALLVNGSVSNGVERRAIGNFRKGPGSGYRGDVSSIMDNSALDARVFSVTGQDIPKSAYNHVKYGFTLGGPLGIPHLFRTNNGNFFVAYQGSRNRNANNAQPSLMPTAAERSGDLSQSLNPLGQPLQFIDPTTGAPFPGNVIPASRISPQAKSLLNLYPQPNFTPSARYNYEIPLVGTSDSDALQTRINKMLNQRNSLNGSLGYQRTGADNPNLFQFVDGTHTQGVNLILSWRHTFNKTLYGTLGAQYSRYSMRLTPFFANRDNISGAAGIGGNNQDPAYWGPPTLSFNSGFGGLGDGQQNFIRNQTSAISLQRDVAEAAAQYHDWRRRPPHPAQHAFAAGPARQFRFHGRGDQQLTANGTPVAGTGSDFADFLLGIPDTSSIAFGNADKYFRSSSYDAYFTDDWRVGAGFTLNAGARWEYSSPIAGEVRPAGEPGYRRRVSARRPRCSAAIPRGR